MATNNPDSARAKRATIAQQDYYDHLNNPPQEPPTDMETWQPWIRRAIRLGKVMVDSHVAYARERAESREAVE